VWFACESYMLALAALRDDLVPVVVAGTLCGEPCVHVHGYPLGHFPQVTTGTTVERIRTLVAMTEATRRYAQTAGMELV
jgi:hypothetical protein